MSPAASVGDEGGGDSSVDRGGRGALGEQAVWMMEPRDRSLMKSEPSLMKGDMREKLWARTAWYTSMTLVSKYRGIR